jgi:methionyl-tRNA formyltransferase
MSNAASKPLKIIFMGTPEFARTILRRLHESDHILQAVFAQPDKPVGRGHKMQSPPVALFAKENEVPLYQPATLKDENTLNELKAFDPDYIIVAAYGKILPTVLLDSFPHKVLNVHASLLPKYRGAAPINYALLKGEKETGVSIMEIIPELDAGPVYLQKSLPIVEEDNALILTEKLSVLGGDALLEALQKIDQEGLQAITQDVEAVTFSPKLTKEMGAIDWQNGSSEISNQIRGLNPWPTAKTALNGDPVKIYACKALEHKSKDKPGTITHIAQAGITIACGQGSLLITEAQVAGKKRMNAFDLANGLRLEVGTRFE